MTDRTKLAEAWAKTRRLCGPGAANRVFREAGGNASDPDSVPASRIAAAIAELERLSSADNSGEPATKPTTLDEIRVGAFARFNNPPTMQKRGG